jgi:hypothetical protein
MQTTINKNPPNGKAQAHRDRKRRGMLIIISDIKGIVPKGFDLASQTVNSAYNLTLYGNRLKMCELIAPMFGDKRIGCCITTTHRLTLPFSTEFFTKNNITVVLNNPTILCFPE